MQLRTKILSAVLLLAFTFSTTGIVMNKHICKGTVKNVSAFVKAEQCGHSDIVRKDIPKCHQKKETKKDNCCENDTEELKNKEQSLTYHKISIEKLSVLHSVLTSFIIEDVSFSKSDTFESYESPPPIAMRQSLHKIYEQFLI